MRSEQVHTNNTEADNQRCEDNSVEDNLFQRLVALDHAMSVLLTLSSATMIKKNFEFIFKIVEVRTRAAPESMAITVMAIS